jgi:hypothetical protein
LSGCWEEGRGRSGTENLQEFSAKPQLSFGTAIENNFWKSKKKKRQKKTRNHSQVRVEKKGFSSITAQPKTADEIKKGDKNKLLFSFFFFFSFPLIFTNDGPLAYINPVIIIRWAIFSLSFFGLLLRVSSQGFSVRRRIKTTKHQQPQMVSKSIHQERVDRVRTLLFVIFPPPPSAS